MQKHLKVAKEVGKHVARRADHLAELSYFSTLVIFEHGMLSVFGIIACGFTIVHIAWTFSQREGE